jgi:hypothetical protein
MAYFNGGSPPSPTGYCVGWSEITRAELEVLWPPESPIINSILRDQELLRADYAKYQHDGHVTEEEARQCFDLYRADHFSTRSYGVADLERCAVCGAWTPGIFQLDNGAEERLILCSEHSKSEFVVQVLAARRATTKT